MFRGLDCRACGQTDELRVHTEKWVESEVRGSEAVPSAFEGLETEGLTLHRMVDAFRTLCEWAGHPCI